MSELPITKPRLLIVAGPNGSGKTSLTGQGLRHQWFEGCLYINPDQIARDEFGDWNSPEAVLKAVRVAESRRPRAIGQRQSLAFETVLSTPEKPNGQRRFCSATAASALIPP